MANYQEAVAYIEPKLTEKPTIGLVLGSGLGVLADEIENPVIIPYHEIPGFTVSTVVGKLQGKQVVAMQGRFHFYEGHGLDAVVFPIRVMKLLGVETIIVTNAAGGINEGYNAGDLMLIRDHINMTFRNPLIGANEEEMGARFPDMSEAYSKELRELAKGVAKEQGVQLQEGVYVGLLGPSYETPAEIRFPTMR
jgi:purine-nucleoside phosphorylase